MPTAWYAETESASSGGTAFMSCAMFVYDLSHTV